MTPTFAASDVPPQPRARFVDMPVGNIPRAPHMVRCRCGQEISVVPVVRCGQPLPVFRFGTDTIEACPSCGRPLLSQYFDGEPKPPETTWLRYRNNGRGRSRSGSAASSTSFLPGGGAGTPSASGPILAVQPLSIVPEPAYCTRCGSEMAPGELRCPACTPQELAMKMKCSECAHWSLAAGCCYCPPELPHVIQFPGETRECPSYLNREEAAKNAGRCVHCSWWNDDRLICRCPHPTRCEADPERCATFRQGERQVFGRAGPHYTGGRGSRPWVLK